MLPGEWLATLEVVLTGAAQRVPVPTGAFVELAVGVNAFAWGFAGTSAGPFKTVPANFRQEIPFDTRTGLWVQGAGTVFFALYGQSASGAGSPIPPPSGDVLLQEDGFALLQEDGSNILLEP